MHLFELTGADGPRGLALDMLLIQADVIGVWEEADRAHVALASPLPDLPWPVGVRWEEVPEPEPVTGLEGDAPLQLARDLVVRPPWVPVPMGFRGIDLVVPRGGAFGSGEHGSTAAALRLLHRSWDGFAGGLPSGAADVGCGSGILLAYCGARGVPRLLGCDIDPAAVRATGNLLPAARVEVGGPDVLEPPVPLVIANMTGTELAGIWPGLLRLWGRPPGPKPSGPAALLVSGLRAAEVAPCIGRMGAEPADREEAGGFTALWWWARG